MFTGIITQTTPVVSSHKTNDGLRIVFSRPAGWDDLQPGESVATNGACLTVAAIRDNEYDCLLVPETLSRTSFSQKLPETVNLERSLTVNDRFGGHFVQGHVDGVGVVTAADHNDGRRLTIQFGAANKQLVIDKGSITVDGVALTISGIYDDKLEVSLIPHTLEHTTLGSLKIGDKVNLEFDVLGKYVLNSLNLKADHAERPANHR